MKTGTIFGTILITDMTAGTVIELIITTDELISPFIPGILFMRHPG